MTKSLRELNDADYAGLFDAMRPIWHAVYDSIVSHEHTEHLLHKYFDVENIRKFRAEGYRYFFIVADAENAGLMVYMDRGTDLYLDKLYVFEAFRRKGLGSYALSHLCNLGNDMHKDVRLNVNRGNQTAIAAYSANGFVVEREENIPQADGGVNCDYVMIHRAEAAKVVKAEEAKEAEQSTTEQTITQNNTTMSKKLTRSASDRKLLGVCAGLAEFFELDPTIMRVVYVLLTLFTAFAGVLVYFVLALIMPEKQ